MKILHTETVSVFISLRNTNILLTWWATVVEVVVTAVAEGMLEYTLDVVKLEPGDRKCYTKTVPEENKKLFLHSI